MGSIEPEAAATTPSAGTRSAPRTPGIDAAAPAAAERAPAPVSADDLRFDLLRNAAYHSDRLAFFERCHRLVMFFSALSGTAAAGAALKNGGALAVAAGLTVAVLTTLDLVFGLTARARHHETQRQRTFTILADLENAPDDPAVVIRGNAALVRLYGEDGADMYAVGAVAWNTAFCATRRDVKAEDLVVVGWLRRLVRNLFPMPGEYLTGREIAQRRARAAGEE